jgi:hypothetical protein
MNTENSLVRVVRRGPETCPLTVAEYDLADRAGTLMALLKERGYIISWEPRDGK